MSQRIYSSFELVVDKITYLYQQLIVVKLQSTFRKKRIAVIWRLSVLRPWNLWTWTAF